MMPSAAPFTNSKSKQTSGGGCGGTGATAGLLPPAQGLNCPRCNSPNTKFCYYNNYSLSQPRYFCKSCRRYWTKGGSLRNVPVGGGCRKSKKNSKSSSPSSLSSSSSSFSHLPLTVGAGAGGDNIPVTELTAAAAAASMDFHIHHNYSSIASSIESLSSMNQDLHWRLQQQRLAQVMYFGGGGGGAGEAQRQRTLTAVEAGNSTAAAETAWFLDGAFPAMNDDDGCRNGETGAAGEWTGIRDWSTVMPHFTVLP